MTSTPTGRRRRIASALLWIVIAFEALTLGSAGIAKFASPTAWSGRFEAWGYPAGFSRVTGALEVIGAILLLVPATGAYAAGLLIAIMTAALATVLTHPGSLGPIAPLVHLALLVPIAVLRFPSRHRAPRPAAPDAT